MLNFEISAQKNNQCSNRSDKCCSYLSISPYEKFEFAHSFSIYKQSSDYTPNEDLMEEICIYLNGIFRELFKKSRHRQKLILLLTLKYKNSRRQTNFTSSYQWSKIVKSIGHAKIYWFHSRKIGFGSCSSTLKQHVGVFFDSFILPEGLPL